MTGTLCQSRKCNYFQLYFRDCVLYYQWEVNTVWGKRKS